ncbi:MAG: uroporphyrinogen-III C-methyltransferase [Vicinamibacterales bacterium]
MPPIVYLIGAGPGAPDLISLRGFRCLQHADVVIYDHKVHPRLLEAARPAAERIDVGSSSPHANDQDAISYLIAEKAREGKVVARVRWGDPFLFGRGGQEALFLHEQGIPFEVVPGVPAAVGSAAYAGIPITYHGGGDTLTLIRGFEDERREKPRVDWTSLSKLSGTLVCLARPSQVPKILDALLSHGRSPGEATAVITDGTLSSQRTLVGTLSEIAKLIEHEKLTEPAMIIVGKVVGLREHLRWFDARPLFGRRVLVTRSREQANDLIDLLEARGAEAVQAPMIRIAPPEDGEPLDRACAQISKYDWIVFSSPNGVHAFFDRLLRGSRDIRALGRAKVCAAGPGTASRLMRLGVAVDLLPADHHAQGMVTALSSNGGLAGTRVLLPRAESASDVLAEVLTEAGATVDEVAAYRTVINESDRHLGIYRQLLEAQLDVVTFTSASAIHAFLAIYGVDQATDLLNHTKVATMGPATSEAAIRASITPAIHLAGGTMAELVDAIVAYLRSP